MKHPGRPGLSGAFRTLTTSKRSGSLQPRPRTPDSTAQMLRVSVHHAREGMVIASPVLHPRRPEIVLLRPGATLDAHTIAKLSELGVHEAWIRYPRLSHLADYLPPSVVHACSTLTGQVSRALDAVLDGAYARLEYPSYRRAVAGLLEKFCEHPRAAVFIDELGTRSSPALRHASNVCLLSVLMGLKLDFYLLRERARLSAHDAKDVSNLGVGAMLHDLGMLRLAPDVRQRFERTQDESDPAFQAHVHIGHELVREQVEASAAAVVLHHHQAYDASGFPARVDRNEGPLGGSDIHIFARIVSVAERFCRLKSLGVPGSGGEPVSTVRALRLMREPALARRFDPVVLKALFNVVPAYAPGTVVMLSSGHECVVTEWSPLDPCRPVVETIVHNDREQPHVFDLRKLRDLSVARAEGVAVGEDNFTPMHARDFDLACVAAGLPDDPHATPTRQAA